MPQTPNSVGGGLNQAEMAFFDMDTQNKIRQLEMDKNTAIQSENYDLAKHLSEQVKRMKSVGMQLQTLQGQKQVAIANENYDEAKQIKQQMDNLRFSALMNADPNMPQ